MELMGPSLYQIVVLAPLMNQGLPEFLLYPQPKKLKRKMKLVLLMAR
jgi:hypothetical protein